jgi:chromosome segregation ATPase
MGQFKESPKPSGPESAPVYGIQQAIDLMRSLPTDLQRTDLVVKVIKRTLESAHIDLGSILADATRREQQSVARIRPLQEEIARFQQEIEARNADIKRLQSELEETSWAKEWLIRAERHTTG